MPSKRTRECKKASEPATVSRHCVVSPKLLARARLWKDGERAVESGLGGPLVEYIRSGSFELCVPCAGPATCLEHIGAYGRECHVVMQDDSHRMESFRKSIQGNVQGKVVVDVGTGPGAVLALMAAHAGATRVYAVEGHQEAAAEAARMVVNMEREGSLQPGVVLVLPKASVDLTFEDIPECCIEVVIHELLGFIASSEGAVHFIRQFRRFLAPGCQSIPELAETLVVPGAMPPMELLVADPVITRDRRRIGPGGKYLLCTRSALPQSLMLAEPQVMEVIDFNDEMPSAEGATTVDDQENDLDFRINHAHTQAVGGLYVWMRATFRVRTEHGSMSTIFCDAWASGATSSWPVVFVPFQSPPTPANLKVGTIARGLASISPSYGFSCPPHLECELTQADMYPWIGGDWCRRCLGVTLSDQAHRTEWAQCSSCHAAFHRDCVRQMEGGGERAFFDCKGSPACPIGQCGSIQTSIAPDLRESRCSWCCPRCQPR